jgi:hypothetical protein
MQVSTPSFTVVAGCLNFRIFNLNLYSISKKAYYFLKTSYLISKKAYCLLKMAFYFLKPQFAFSFRCFPQAKGAFTFSNPSLLSHFGVFRKQKELLLSQTPVCFLILVFSASKKSFYLLKPQFACLFK